MVFAYGSGANTAQAFPEVGLDFRMERRVALSTHAILYALDARTGKELWSSGDQIGSWNHFSGNLAGEWSGIYQRLPGKFVLLRIEEVSQWSSLLL